MTTMTQLILDADRALAKLVRGFVLTEQTGATSSDLEDALQMVHDAKRQLLNLGKSVRQSHDTNKTT